MTQEEKRLEETALKLTMTLGTLFELNDSEKITAPRYSLGLFPHDQACSRAHRWGRYIAEFDNHQRFCFMDRP